MMMQGMDEEVLPSAQRRGGQGPGGGAGRGGGREVTCDPVTGPGPARSGPDAGAGAGAFVNISCAGGRAGGRVARENRGRERRAESGGGAHCETNSTAALGAAVTVQYRCNCIIGDSHNSRAQVQRYRFTSLLVGTRRNTRTGADRVGGELGGCIFWFV